MSLHDSRSETSPLPRPHPFPIPPPPSFLMHFKPISCISFILVFSRYSLITYVKPWISRKDGQPREATLASLLFYLDDSRSSDAFDDLHMPCCLLSTVSLVPVVEAAKSVLCHALLTTTVTTRTCARFLFSCSLICFISYLASCSPKIT